MAIISNETPLKEIGKHFKNLLIYILANEL